MTSPRSLLPSHPLPILPSRGGTQLCPQRPPSPQRGASCAPVSAAAPPRGHRNGRHQGRSSLPCEAAAAPRAGGWGGGHGRRRRCPPTPPPRDVNRGRFARPLPGQRSPPALTALRARPPPAPRRRGEAAVEEEEEEDEAEEKAPEGLCGQCRLPPPPSLPPSLSPRPPGALHHGMRRSPPPQHGCGGVTVPPLRERGGGGGEGASRPRARLKGSPVPPSLPPSFSPSPGQRGSLRDLASLLGKRRSLTRCPRSVAPAGTVVPLF